MKRGLGQAVQAIRGRWAAARAARSVPAPRWRRLRHAVHLLSALAVLPALLAGWLAWRLAEGPLPLPLLARRLEQAVNDASGLRLAVGEAAIAWEGFRSGAGAPLDIRLRGVRAVDPGGGVRAELPEASVTLSFGALLRGRVVPATIELRRPALMLVRRADGEVGLGDTAEAGADDGPLLAVLRALMLPASERKSYTAFRRLRLVDGEITVADQALATTWALQEVMLDIRRQGEGGLVADGGAALRLGAMVLPVRLSGQALGTPMRVTAGVSLPALSPPELARALPVLAPLAVVEAPLALAAFADFDAAGRPLELRARLSAGAGQLDLGQGRHLPFAGLEALAAGSERTVDLREVVLRLPGHGGQPGPAIELTGHADRVAGAWDAHLALRLPALRLREVEHIWPDWLAPEARRMVLPRLDGGRLAEADARLALHVPADLNGPEWREAAVRLVLDHPVLNAYPMERAELVVFAQPGEYRLHRLSLALPGQGRNHGPPSPPTMLAGGAELVRQGEGWRLRGDVALDQMDLADLPGRWPQGLAPAPRGWLTENLTAGLARNGAWQFEARLPVDFAGFDLTALSGGLEVTDATVHWLRPVPPLMGVDGTVEFTANEVVVRAQEGRQAQADGRPGNLLAREATLRFHGLDAEPGFLDIQAQLGGPLPEVMTVLQHPRLKLFEKRPLTVQARSGTVEARLAIAFPLWSNLPLDQLRLRATGRTSDARLDDLVQEKDLERATLDFAVDTDSLKLTGDGRLGGIPVRLGVDMDFRGGPATQVVERAQVSGRMDAAQLADWGLDPGRLLTGPLPVEARWERRRNGQGTLALNADLRPATLALAALGWAKPPGTAGTAEAVLRIVGPNLTAMESFRLEALELSLRGRASFRPGSRLERLELTESVFGGSRLLGEVRPPAVPGQPWQAALRGPLLDLRPLFGPSGHVEGGGAAAAEPDRPDPPLLLDLRFDRVTMGEGRDLLGVQARARTDAQGLLREARVTGATAPNAPFEATLTPRGPQRALRLIATDGGALLRALDILQPVQGGRLLVNAAYPELRPGAPLVGTAELDGFVVRDAPAIGKILQAMTLFGLVDAMSGPGLNFSRLVAPFRLTPEALELTDARAFSASLGVTAKGRVLRERPGQRMLLELEGTIVPAYMFNALLGNLPVLGRLFSPEAGGGLFAATWRVMGPPGEAQVTMNPLAALTPGFLRGLFGIVEGPAPAPSGNGQR